MKLEYQSRNLLASTKSAAKLIEFQVPAEFHYSNSGALQDLLILSIGILGQLAGLEFNAGVSQNSDIDSEFEGLKRQLIHVAQYFDALDTVGVESKISSYLILLGSAAYYLAEMPGSASVLAKKLSSEQQYGLTDSAIEGPLVYLLKGDYTQRNYVRCKFDFINNLINAFGDFLDQVVDAASVVDYCHIVKQEIYENGTDRELFIGDVIIAVISRKISNSAINCLPLYTEIPLENWSNLLRKNSFITEFWPAQILLGKEKIFSGRSAVIQMPTSAGKTKSAEIIIRSAFLSERANLAVIVAPFRALCRELTDTFKSAFVDEPITINELLDVPQISEEDAEFMRFLLGDRFRDPKLHKAVLIATPEKLVYLLRHQPEIAPKIGLLIFDEGHQFDTGDRGVTYELLVASLIAAVSKETQKILISAVISNGKTIGDWLYGDSGTAVYGSHCLPTNRAIAFASWTEDFGQLNYLDSEKISEREFIVPRIIEQIDLGKRGKERNSRVFPDLTKPTTIPSYLGMRLSHLGTVAVFCGTKLTVNAVCNNILRAYDRGLSMQPPSSSSDSEEIGKLWYLAKLHFGSEDTVTRSIALGILPHSAGIPNGLRVSIEWAVAHNRASMVVCTSTLSQGVNLPIKYLVIASTKQSTEDIKKRDFHNLMGRAGRSGYHTEGSVIFADVKLFQNRFKFRGDLAWEKTLELLDVDKGDDCVSSLKDIILPCPTVAFDWKVLAFIKDPNLIRARADEMFSANSNERASVFNFLADIEAIIQKIESFMLSFYKDNPTYGDVVVFGELAKRTLAYHMSSDAEKIELIEIFRGIGENVLSIPIEKIAYFGKALLGIAQLTEIEEWAVSKRFELSICESKSDLLICCWPILVKMARNEIVSKITPQEIMLSAADAWIRGCSYQEILKIFEAAKAVMKTEKREAKMTMLNVVDFADSALGYDAMLIIGALADIIEGSFENEALSLELRSLQSSLKLGLNSDFQKLAYSKGYTDRELCKAIEKFYEDNGALTDFIDPGIFRRDRPFLDDFLKQFPTYFSKLSI